MTDDLVGRVRTWLESEGYPFELRVGRVLREAQWDVFHGRHYTDPETGKLREIDIHAAFGPYVGNSHGVGMVSVHLVCECKVSVSKPWVVFTTSIGDDSERLVGRLAPGEVASRVLADATATGRRLFRTLCVGPRVGHALTRAFSDSKAGDPSGPYSAVLGALSAASVLSAKHESAGPRGESLAQWTSIYLPIVILNGPLFEFYLDDEGNEVLQNSDRVQVLAHRPSSETDPVLVQIVASSGLVSFAQSMHSEAVSLAQFLIRRAEARQFKDA